MSARGGVEEFIADGLTDDGRGGSRGCEWDESVCTNAPTHRMRMGVHLSPGDAEKLRVEPGPEVSTFCARHYVIALRLLIDVHLRICDLPISAHVTEFGEVGG